tara:strand:- start:336 stop:923 length:588 start_codon:yes stop_codon:yes gene_type:complete
MLWYGAIFLFVVGNMLSFMMDGSSGIAATNLSANITASEQYIPLTSTNGFMDSDVRIFIDDEQLSYTSLNTAPGTCGAQTPPCMDTGLAGRGYNGTIAAAHTAGAKVYSESMGTLNDLLGFRIGELTTVWGKLSFPVTAALGFGNFVSKALMWDYSFLEGNGMYIKVAFLFPLSGMMVLGLARIFSNAIGFLLRS